MMKLGQMTPSLAGRYTADQRLPHAKARGDVTLQHSAFDKPFDLRDLGLRQFGSPMFGTLARCAQTIRVSVQAILATRDPFKIARAVIQLVAVNVVHFVARGRCGPKEGVSNQAMSHSPVLDTPNSENGSIVSASMLEGENVVPPRGCADSSKIRDLMRCLKSNNGSPNFFHNTTSYLDALRRATNEAVLQQVNKGEFR